MRQDGLVAFGCQHQGSAEDAPPLLGLLRPGGAPRMLEVDDDTLFRMRNYIGSFAFDDSGGFLIGTSPQGGSAFVWDMANGRVARSVMLPDVCGAAASGIDSFMLTSGNAGLAALDRSGLSTVSREQRWIWDNHTRLLRLA